MDGPHIGTSAENFFQSDHDLSVQKRRAAKQNNKSGDPIVCTSKVLCMLLPDEPNHIYIGESGFIARKKNLLTGKTVGTFSGHNGPVTCLALWYKDGAAYLITGSWDKTLRKFDVESKESLVTFTYHTDFVKSLVVSHTRSRLYSGSSDQDIRSWDLLTDKPLQVFKGHKRGIEDLAFDEGENFLYSASSDRLVMKWNPLTAECLQVFEGHLTSIYSLKVFDEEMWTASADMTVKRWDLITGKPDTSFDHPDFVKCIAFFGSYVITGSRDEMIRIFDIGSGKLICEIEGHFDEVSCMAIRGTTLYTGSLDCTIRKWLLVDIINPKKDEEVGSQVKTEVSVSQKEVMLTEEEEKELAELLGSDDE
ncbi:18726_t:CDS:2 [Acaulospora morrowiae]|uniref:18726_t:CDS:1 n=1 Tax=Acaulospora morrowiae TaxID=94023 RepID=A0A9N9BHZ2_9GLOM|nr:18726_t:CDS:2 [Acaulospora morrowiae]